MKQEDIITVPSFDLLRSSPLTAGLRKPGAISSVGRKESTKPAEPGTAVPMPPPYDDGNASSILAYRTWIDSHFYPRIIAKLRAEYNVQIQVRQIAGVYTEVIAPEAGVPPKNKKRVLINLHAGGFTFGARLCGQIESIPIASLGGYEVFSVDYRLAPEHRYPAAVDDVVAVYKELLNTHDAGDIGVFGYSAGGLLAAQCIAKMQKESLPLPGALVLLFGGAIFWGKGDSSRWGPAISGRTLTSWEQHLYFQDADADDPLVFPLLSAEILSRFPPSLLISASRDFALSSVVHTHSRLVNLGVPAQLHVWEGVGHAFSHDFRLPQSPELYAVVLRFFDAQLQDRNL